MYLLVLRNIMMFSRWDELWLSLSTAKLMHGSLQIVQTCANQLRLKKKSNKNSSGGLWHSWHIPPYSPEYTHGQQGACGTYLIECEMFSQVSSETLECGIIWGPEMQVWIQYCPVVCLTRQVNCKTSRVSFTIAVGLQKNDAVYLQIQF